LYWVGSVDNLEGVVFEVFTLYIFTLGFAIPIALIVVFYGIMLRRLFMRSRRLPTSQVRLSWHPFP
jgi:cytochrome c biogenesis protein CcdA